jgi:hypothetical protein
LQITPNSTQPLPTIVFESAKLIVPENVLRISGTNTLPRHLPVPAGSRSRNSRVPIRFGVPPLRASACAFSLAQVTVPHNLPSHLSMRTWTLLLGLRHSVASGGAGSSAKAGAAVSASAANATAGNFDRTYFITGSLSNTRDGSRVNGKIWKPEM